MEFKKFTSIENSYRQKEIQSIQINFPGATFVVQEKVHGSNFSFWTDGNEIKCAKRSGFLKEGESFFDYEIVLDRYSNNIKQIFTDLKNGEYIGEELQELVIFGEIYGGTYPHKDVKALSVTKVQKGVFYSPDVDFIAFDIKANGKYINFKKFRTICMVGQIPFLDAIAEGTLEECLAINNAYPTTIPELHGLPEIEDNICEGNVIRPIEVLYFGNGQRIILKNKNEIFSERKQGGNKEPKPEVEVPDYVVELQNQGVLYITENRLKNVLSKVGSVTNKDFGKLLGLLSKDVMEDFTKDNPKVSELNSVEKKMITRLINNECGNLIRPNFLNIIDGDF